MEEFLNSSVFTWVVLPCLICLARMIDVSLGTLRIIFVSRGLKFLAPAVGFFEIIIWLVAIGQVMQNLDHVINYFAYAFGFSLGNFFGIILEQKLAMGKNVVRIIVPHDASELIKFLRGKGFSLTVVDGEGSKGNVHVLFTVIKRSQLPLVVSSIKKYHPKAFYTVEDIRLVSGGIFAAIDKHATGKFMSLLKMIK